MFIINYILGFILYIKINSYLYFSIYINEVDDCIYNISTYRNIVQNKYFNFFEKYTENNCSYNYIKYDSPLIRNKPYEFGEIISMEVKDNISPSGFVSVDVKINEYNIYANNNKFWKCLNCQTNDKNYFFKNNSFYFYKYEKYATNNTLYNFTFQINSFSELNNQNLEINNSFYELSGKTFDHSLNYKYYELELINFNTTDNFYIIDNRNLSVNYSNYYFKVSFSNKFSGILKGLNLNNSYTNITNNGFFRVNETNGLIYQLSEEENKNYGAYLQLKIIAYNIYLNKRVTREKSFIFNITLTGDYLKCLFDQKTNKPDSEKIYHYFCQNLTQEKLYNNISEFILRIEKKKKYEINGSDIIIYISPINSIFYNDSKREKMTFCEQTLKNYYDISSSELITFMQIEVNNSNINNYAYDEKNQLLNLSLCEDINICYKKTYYQYDNITKKFYTCLNKTKEQLIQNLSELFENIEIGQTYEIKGDDYNIKISPTNATDLSSASHINFTKCIDLLRTSNGISPSRYITIMQLEINNTNSKTLINKIEYQAYDDNKKLLNLSICEDEDIKVIHSIKSSSLFDKVTASLFKDLGIDIFNINDSFFTDVCHSYSDSENDMTLKDRIKHLFQNFSLCEERCSYDEIDLGNMTVVCDCKVKTNIDTNFDNITVNLFPYEEKNANFKIIKCYNLVFSLKGKLNNIGFWIFLVLVMAHIPFLILYFRKGIEPIREYIIGQMEKYGYIEKSKKKNLNNNDNIKNNKFKDNKNKSLKNKKQKFGQKNASPPKNKNNEQKIINKKLKAIRINKTNKIKNTKRMNSINLRTSISNSNRNNLIDSKHINMLITQDNKEEKKIIRFKAKKSTKKGKSNNIFNFNIININIKNKKRIYKPLDSNKILNNYNFEEAIKYDLRSICLIYYIILLSKQAIFHAFLFNSPLEIFPLRFCLFIFIYSSDLALNAFFYLDDKISEKYNYTKSLFLFAFSNNITVILLSTLVGFLFMTLFTNLGNSTNEIRNVFRNEEKKLIKSKKYTVTDKRKKEIQKEINKILKKYKIKIIILITIEFLLMLFFWYYVTAFCHVYNSTQYSWLFDSFLSILSRTVIDFLLPMGLAKLYRLAVESNIKCLYKIVLFFYSFA